MIRSTWKRISIEFSKTNANVFGQADIVPTDVFIKMFEKYPESRNYFLQFKDTQTEELQQNSKLLNDLKAHAARVFLLVEKVILSMDHNLENVRF